MIDDLEEIRSSPNSPKKSTRKVQYAFSRRQSNIYKKHPVIHIGGLYLNDFDFKIGDSIEVAMELGKIIITKTK